MNNTVPRFVKDPRTWQVKVAAATPRANAAGEGTTFLFVNGETRRITRIDWIRLNAETEVADSLLLVFKLDKNGVTHLFDALSISATSAGSGKIAEFETELQPTKPLYLTEDESLYVGSNITTGTVSVFATGGLF